MLEPKTTEERHAYHYTLPSSRHEGGMWLYWLVQLRWVALVAQAVVLAFSVRVLHQPAWTVPAMVATMWVLLVANHRALRTLESDDEVQPIVLFNHLFLDMVALTVLLMLSGGAANPFAILYVVHVAMGALVLAPQAAAFLTLAALVCWLLLHVVSLPLHLEQHAWLAPSTLMVSGQVMAFAVTLGSVAFFVIGAANSWRRREAQLRQARARLGHPNTEEVPWPLDLTEDRPVRA
ncbi:MAG: hypothetical protein H6733_16515 [Alphaproteobacteria bacterium]|nr:hypothetical protein [Alphaproteobacteria bacterium]